MFLLLRLSCHTVGPKSMATATVDKIPLKLWAKVNISSLWPVSVWCLLTAPPPHTHTKTSDYILPFPITLWGSRQCPHCPMYNRNTELLRVIITLTGHGLLYLLSFCTPDSDIIKHNKHLTWLKPHCHKPVPSSWKTCQSVHSTEAILCKRQFIV